MMLLMKAILTIIILGAGFYFLRKPLSRTTRATAAIVTLAACAIVWLVTFAPDTPVKIPGTNDQAQIPSQPQPKEKVTGQKRDTATPAVQPASGGSTSQTTTAKTTPRDASQATGPVSDPIAPIGENTDDVNEPDPVVANVDDQQLDELIGDATPVKLEGSTMVDTIVKKGTIQAAERNSPSEDDYSFPEVVKGSEGMTMIIPDEPLPAVSSRRQLTTGDDDEIPAPGEVVALTYDMFSWSTGQMVESSKTILNGPLMYRLGGKDSPIGIPKYLDEAIHDRPYGSTVQVVFEKQMDDLPGYMDRNDGYVLVVRVDKPEVDGETALESMKNTVMQ